MMIAGTASAEVTTNIEVPYNNVLVIPCSSDVVVATGFLHLTASTTVDGAGGVHATFLGNPKGVKGVVTAGPNLGATYQVNGVTREDVNLKVGQTHTYINNFIWIGQG